MKLLMTLLILISCSEKELPNYSGSELLAMGRVGDPSLSLVIPKDMATAAVNCYAYTPNCRYGYRIKLKHVEMKALFYDKQENALMAAKRARAYISRNWVFDDVTGEPILERFVVKYLDAKKAE